MKKMLDEDFYIDDEEDIEAELQQYEQQYDLPDCSRCGAKPGFGQNVDNQGYTQCTIDEHQGIIVDCNKCEDRMC